MDSPGGNRTPNLAINSRPLYQIELPGIVGVQPVLTFGLMPSEGIEPSTSRLKGACSACLSYEGKSDHTKWPPFVWR